MAKSSVKPTVGRVVMFVPEPLSKEAYNFAGVVPAIIVRTWENTTYENDEVNLKIFCDGPETTWKTSVPYDPDKKPHSWHWPERG
jgi:hypothetical protein